MLLYAPKGFWCYFLVDQKIFIFFPTKTAVDVYVVEVPARAVNNILTYVIASIMPPDLALTVPPCQAAPWLRVSEGSGDGEGKKDAAGSKRTRRKRERALTSGAWGEL
jgi:hypothetical protein